MKTFPHGKKLYFIDTFYNKNWKKNLTLCFQVKQEFQTTSPIYSMYHVPSLSPYLSHQHGKPLWFEFPTINTISRKFSLYFLYSQVKDKLNSMGHEWPTESAVKLGTMDGLIDGKFMTKIIHWIIIVQA